MGLGYLNRDFNEGRGLFYNGVKENSLFAYDSTEAKKRWNDNFDKLEKVEITIPPKKKITFSIPLVEDGEVDETFYDFVYDKKTDSILSGVLEIFLKSFVPLKGGLFKRAENSDIGKFDSVNLEKFQSMKDIIMGRFRITPVKIPVSKDGDDIKYFDWNIGSDNYDVEYEHNGKIYKTNHFGIYASNFRVAMFSDADDYDFYGGHTMQYRQRIKEFESGYITYTNACRGLGKSISESFRKGIDFIREIVFRGERSRPFLGLYYGATKSEVEEIFQYTISMYKALLTAAGGDKLVNKLLHHSKANGVLTLYDGNDKRRLKTLSENQSGRGSRPFGVTLDELAKFKKADETLKEVLGFGKCPISIISTVKSETIRNEFYDNRSSAYSGMRKYEETMFDIVHDIRWKYGFGKCKKPEDYLQMAKDGVFDKARSELFKRRPVVGLKYTIDDSEVKSEDEKDLEIEAMLSESGYGGLMAEFYGVVLSDKSMFKTSGCVVDDVPHLEGKKYQHIYFSYDEADEYDNPAVAVGGIYEGKLYIVESQRLTADLTKRYDDMKVMYEKRRNESIGGVTTIIADVNRGLTIREKIVEKLGKLDVPFKFTRDSAKEDYKIANGNHIVNKGWLVRLLGNEYLPKGKILIAGYLNNEGGLLEEMSNYVSLGGGKYGASKKNKDDQITAVLQIIYSAHLGYFKGIRQMGFEGLDQQEIRKRMIQMDMNAKRNKELLKNKRDVLGRYF